VTEFLLPVLFFVVAFIYSSVGLGGGSSYTAIMAIMGVSYTFIPTTSLTLNLVVTFIGMVNFWRKGYGRINLIIPFLLTSVPITYLASTMELPEIIFKIILISTLILVTVRLYIFNSLTLSFHLSGINKWFVIIGLGSTLGFIAGSVGIGGGIYLVPLIVMFGLGTEKEASAAGAMFIWANSLVGVVARIQSDTFDFNFILPLVIVVLIGGFFGSYLGAFKLKSKIIQKIMGGVVIFAIILLIKGL